jgi:hypothetical protein
MERTCSIDRSIDRCIGTLPPSTQSQGKTTRWFLHRWHPLTSSSPSFVRRLVSLSLSHSLLLFSFWPKPHIVSESSSRASFAPSLGASTAASLDGSSEDGAAAVAVDGDRISAAHPLRVLIAGAGVGGLALANVLAKHEHIHVTVLEQTAQFKRFGGPIQLARCVACVRSQRTNLQRCWWSRCYRRSVFVCLLAVPSFGRRCCCIARQSFVR